MRPAAHPRGGDDAPLAHGPMDIDLSASVPITSAAECGTSPLPRGVRMLERTIPVPEIRSIM
ncbi:hypothetical protein GCM10022403_026490 [Streptomyces coacervatus]|uniref:Uncharacterized protein n=1 Tax=Streptomyces coacervatus TaxID=647381 RepID=A0ABP7HCM3_9ACTN